MRRCTTWCAPPSANVPPGSSICCVSRTEAPPSFAQLAATGAVFGLHWDMLRLTLDETREISAAREVREDWLVRALHQQSEGWAAGITLMLERLGHVAADTGDASRRHPRVGLQLFREPACSTAPRKRLAKRCLSVAFLPHVTASMATTLSGREEAGQVLDQLYRRHLFTDRRPAAEPIYQFHALFREFLQTRVRQEHETRPKSGVEDALRRGAGSERRHRGCDGPTYRRWGLGPGGRHRS